MKIIAGAFILLVTAMGLPMVVGEFELGAPGAFVEVPASASKDFCRLTYDQIAKENYPCDTLLETAVRRDVLD